MGEHATPNLKNASQNSPDPAHLLEENRRLKLATSTAGIGIWVWDALSNALIWDECMHRIYATPPERRDSLDYNFWANRLHPDDRERAESELADAIDNAKEFVSNFRILLPSGRIKHVRAHGGPEKDQDNNLIRFVGINEDITENRQLSLDLQEAIGRFDLAASGASSGIWDWQDLSSDRSYWSPKFYELLGYQPDELEASISTFQKELIHPDDLAAGLEAGNALIAENKPFDVEYRLRHKNGSYRWFRGTAILARDQAGNPSRMVGSIQDIHDRKEYEQLLKASNAELQQFAYICSHDLKTPLRGIRTYCEILEEDFVDTQSDEEKETIKKIVRQVDRMDRFISDLLIFSQVGRVGLAGTEVNIQKLVEEMILDFRPAFADQNVEIAIEGRLPTVFADRTRVGEIFKNLVENGIKYNESSAKAIRIGCENGDVPIFYVKDNGIGIPEEHQESVFRIFRRLHRQEEYGGGSGAGLSIVKKIVDRHQGQIWIENTQPTGTVFKFTLNLTPPGGKERKGTQR